MWSPLHTMAFIKSVLVDAAERREERGASFTEYVVLVAVVVAFVIGIGFTDLGSAITSKITEISGQIGGAGDPPASTGGA
jgi:Flp pilus assembly pilin Flp